MINSLLLVAAIGILVICIKRWQKLPAGERKQFGMRCVLWGGATIVFGLVLTGRAHWLMGVLAALLALASRVAQIVQYIPLFKKIFSEAQTGYSDTAQQVAGNHAMSRQQAADILGVDINASHEEIRLAHKKLMQKIHPDRGGSDALAKQINQAKKVLIK